MWEYKTVYVKWDVALATQNNFDEETSTPSEEQPAVYDWVAEYEDGYKDIGWFSILNEWGSFGWELVNVAPAGQTDPTVTAYFAFFKRKREPENDDDNS
jgi:hypothetical protein